MSCALPRPAPRARPSSVLRPIPRRVALTLALVVAVLFAVRGATAADVRFQLPDSEVYAGVPFRMYIRVVNATDRNAPVLPDIAGATAQAQISESRTSTVIRNGRASETVTTVWAIEITAQRPGKLSIPPVTITVDGSQYSSQATTVDVKKGDAGDVFAAEVFGTPPEVFIGQPLELVLRIGIKPFRDPTYGTLNETQMWQLMDIQASEWGVFGPGLQRLGQDGRDTPPVQQEQRNGQTWYVYEITRTIWPPRTGKPDLGQISLRMKYPLSLREVQGIFSSQLVLGGSRPAVTEAKVNQLTVLPLPEKGRPAGFTGAVGQFSITATAKPTVAAVQDPISLTLVIIDRTPGGTNLDTLQPPDLSQLAVLKRDFRVPSDPLSGTASTSRKTFVQTIRPLRTEVTEIPSIPFSYFDPTAREYRTVTTDPISITVTPAPQMDLSRIERSGGSESSAAIGPSTQLTEVHDGLVANKPVTVALLANDQLRFSAGVIAGLCGPPLLVGAAAAWRLNRSRHEKDSGLARRSRARRTAQRRLEAATDAAGIARAVTGYVEDQLGRPEGTMTRGDLHAALSAQAVAGADRDSVVALLSECDRAVYAASASPEQAARIRGSAAAVLDALDRVRWRRGQRATA